MHSLCVFCMLSLVCYAPHNSGAYFIQQVYLNTVAKKNATQTHRGAQNMFSMSAAAAAYGMNNHTRTVEVLKLQLFGRFSDQHPGTHTVPSGSNRQCVAKCIQCARPHTNTQSGAGDWRRILWMGRMVRETRIVRGRALAICMKSVYTSSDWNGRTGN